MKATPRLVVVSGPSGVGKTTVCSHLLERPEFERVVTATTRPPRKGEVEGRDYFFLPEETFDAWVEEERFLEWATVYGRRYGSPRAAAEAILKRGRHALLNIDVQGAASIRAAHPTSLLVFLMPPSRAELVRRIDSRGSESAETKATRMRTAREEMARSGEFDLVVVNDESRRAAEEIALHLAPRG